MSEYKALSMPEQIELQKKVEQMSKGIDPLDVIAALKDISSLNGKCYEVSRLLKVIYPQATAWYDGEHVITRINGRFYDKSGLVEHRPYLPESSQELDRHFQYRCDKNGMHEYPLTHLPAAAPD